MTPPKPATTHEDPPNTSEDAVTLPETTIPTPLKLRTEAWEAFRAHTLFLVATQLELGHVSTLLALLVDGE
jgi:hypothetical protein